jgi:hypothetical protein
MAFPTFLFIDNSLIPNPITTNTALGGQITRRLSITTDNLSTSQTFPVTATLTSAPQLPDSTSMNTSTLIVKLLNNSLCKSPPPLPNSDNISLTSSRQEPQEITIVGNLIRYKVTTTIPLWSPQLPLPYAPITTNILSKLLSPRDLQLLRQYTSCPPSTKILSCSNNSGYYITTKDLQNLLSYNQPIYHELLILSLENLCSMYISSYLDPSFFNTLSNWGWSAV